MIKGISIPSKNPGAFEYFYEKFYCCSRSAML